MLPSLSGSYNNSAVVCAVNDLSQVGEARRLAMALAQRQGFDHSSANNVAIVVTEAASNLVKHASGGELLLIPVEHDGNGGLEVLALDEGPGMADLERCLRDGYSTAGSAGNGLGAIQRLASAFDIYTVAQSGSALLARMGSHRSRAVLRLQSGAVQVSKPGEEVCGDAWAGEQQPGRVVLFMADGLGHGPIAAEAASEAVRIFRENSQRGPVEIMEFVHAALRSTRGAAVAVADVDFEGRKLRFAGVGNIAGTVFAAGSSHSAVSHNGTVGHQVRRIQEFTYPFPQGALLILHSDGLATHWRLEQYPGLAARDPSLIAGVLYRDFKRGRDDVTVVVAREADA